MAEWLRSLIFSAVNGSSSHRCVFKLESGETSQVLFVGGQVFFLGDFPFSSHLTIDSAQNE